MESRFTVNPISAFADNYIWLIDKAGSDDAVIIDPGDPRPVMEEIAKRGLVPRATLITHKHRDHIGGLLTLTRNFPQMEVYGPAAEPIPCRTHAVREGDIVSIEPFGLQFEVMEVPGHTAGHIAYHEPRRRWLFCGDTLFVSGCGRVFDGTHEQLFASLERIRGLPESTLCFCAHEYTLDNIGFARWVEPGNAHLDIFEAQCRQRRAQGLPTVPNTIRGEKLCNPFLRLDQEAVIAGARAWSQNSDCPLDGLDPGRPADTFHLIRNWKDVAYD